MTPLLAQFFFAADFLFEEAPGERILKLYEDWGKPEKVVEWKQKLQAAKAAAPAAKP